MTLAEAVEEYLRSQGKDSPEINTGDFLATFYREDAVVRVSRVAIAEGEHYGFKKVAVEGNRLIIETQDNQPHPRIIGLRVLDEEYTIAARLLGEEEVL